MKRQTNGWVGRGGRELSPVIELPSKRNISPKRNFAETKCQKRFFFVQISPNSQTKRNKTVSKPCEQVGVPLISSLIVYPEHGPCSIDMDMQHGRHLLVCTYYPFVPDAYLIISVHSIHVLYFLSIEILYPF
jgi:hypothetical protein